MKKFKVKMVRTYTTEIEVEAECKGNILDTLNNHPDTERSWDLWDKLADEELDQCDIGKERFYVKQIV